MSLVGRVVRGAGLQAEALGSNVVVEQLFGGVEEADGARHVSVERAVGLPAVFRAIRLFSETCGAMPLITYRRGADDDRQRARQHPSYSLLHDQPNPSQDAVTFWTLIFNHMTSWGRVIIGKEMVGTRVVALHALRPDQVRIERLANGRLLFHEQRSSGMRTWTDREVLYSMLFTLDGLNGLSPIGLARETLGLAIDMRKHGSKLFRDSAIPAGALSVEKEIRDPDVRSRMRAEWKARHQGKRDIAILDAGAKFQAITMPLDDAQFVELWGATRTDVADFFNMPASLLTGKTGDSLTYGNRESDMRQFLTFTLHNPLKKIETALSNDRDLFPQVNTFFSEFNREGLLQPDSQARGTYYRLALDPKFGWMRRDEVRSRENLPAEDPSEAPPVTTLNNGGSE